MNILQFQFIVLFAVTVYFGDRAISAAIAHDLIRTLCYGIVSVLSLIVLILSLGIH